MEAQIRTRSEVLAASLAQAEADLATAPQARARFDERYCELRALAAEQASPTAQARYTNSSVIQAGMRAGQDREIGVLLTLIQQLKQSIAKGDDVSWLEQREAMDETHDFRAVPA